MKTLWTRLALLMLVGVTALSGLEQWQALASEVINDTFVTHPFSHNHWHMLVSETVDSQGRVNFSQLRVTPKRLTQYLKQLAQESPLSHPEDFPDRKNRMAYWINAHNALTLRLILDVYPVRTLQEVPRLKSSTRYRLGGIPTSIEAIETLMAEQFYPWPNGFLALSDLTVDSPRLLNEAYRPEVLDEQLETQYQWAWTQPQLIQYAGTCQALQISGALKPYQGSWLQYLREKRPLAEPSLVEWIKPALSPDMQGELASLCPEGEQDASGGSGVEYLPRQLDLNRLP